MGCCDRNRRAATVAVARATSTRVPVVRSSHAAPTPRVHYLGQRTVDVRGGVSGRRYRFDARNRTQAVDPRDIVGLLRTRFFRRA
jgi:hypothetical protein